MSATACRAAYCVTAAAPRQQHGAAEPTRHWLGGAGRCRRSAAAALGTEQSGRAGQKQQQRPAQQRLGAAADTQQDAAPAPTASGRNILVAADSSEARGGVVMGVGVGVV